MFLILNRIRGTYKWASKVIALMLFVITYLLSDSLLIATLIGAGYWLGELICGWGDHMGNITECRYTTFDSFPEDGSSVGARWFTSMLVYPKLWKLHLVNAKIGIYNLYPKTINLPIKGYSLAKLLNIEVVSKNIETFTIDKALLYSRVYLFVRGIYWWLLPMTGISLWVNSFALGCGGLLALSLLWIIAAELVFLLIVFPLFILLEFC